MIEKINIYIFFFFFTIPILLVIEFHKSLNILPSFDLFSPLSIWTEIISGYYMYKICEL